MALVNSFLSYLLLVLVFAAVAGAGAVIGIHKRNVKNRESEQILTDNGAGTEK